MLKEELSSIIVASVLMGYKCFDSHDNVVHIYSDVRGFYIHERFDNKIFVRWHDHEKVESKEFYSTIE